MLNSVSGASTIAKIDYWEQTDEMDAHAAYILNMSEVSASYCWSQGHKMWSCYELFNLSKCLET